MLDSSRLVASDAPCPHCGYNLRGLPADNLCPECGHPIRNQLLDAAGIVAFDVPCRKCGYNVRALSADGLCPECAHPVRLSLCSDHLRFADAAWLRRVEVGLRLSFWGKLGRELTRVGVPMVFFFVPLASGVSRVSVDWWSGLTLLIMYALGAWFLAEPDPGAVDLERPLNARVVVRVLAIAGIAGYVAGMAYGLALNAPPSPIFLLLWMLVGLLNVVGEFAKLHYLRGLAERMPERRQGRRARFLQWAYGGGLLLSWGIAWAAWIPGWAFGGSSSYWLNFYYVGLLWSVPLFVLSIIYVMFFSRMAAGVRAAIRESQFSSALQNPAPGERNGHSAEPYAGQ